MSDENNAKHKQAERDRKRELGLVRFETWLPISRVKDFRLKAEKAVKEWLEPSK